jgi:hypothetical protein
MTSRLSMDINGRNEDSGVVGGDDVEQQFVIQQHGASATAVSSMNNSISSHDTSRQTDFSFCILWSPWPYSIGTSRKAIMAFGPTTRYLKMDIGQLSNVERWDEAIREADRVYSGRMHSE